MKIRFFKPHAHLSTRVSQIWTVESPAGYTPDDIKTIVPNGRMKLVFPYRGSLLNGAITPGAAATRPLQKNPTKSSLDTL
jgi:hypothetical protein